MGGKNSKKSLSEEDLSFLVKSTSMPEKELKEWHKGFQKDCPTGELSKEKFISMYNSMFPNGNPEKFSENVFRTFDTNKNGTIDFREFMLALHITSNGTSEEKLAWAFRMYDIDGNGSVDFAEMKRVLSAVLEVMGVSEGHLGRSFELFTTLNQDKDGLVSQEEFMKAVKNDKSLMDALMVDNNRNKI